MSPFYLLSKQNKRWKRFNPFLMCALVAHLASEASVYLTCPLLSLGLIKPEGKPLITMTFHNEKRQFLVKALVQCLFISKFLFE